MTQVLPAQVTVVGEKAPHSRPAQPPPGSPMTTNPRSLSGGAGGEHASDDQLELILLELTLRAPAPAVGPSHWWG